LQGKGRSRSSFWSRYVLGAVFCTKRPLCYD
jgi:hypothetical protein